MRRAVLHLKRADPVLAGIIERVGPYRILYAEPDFETLVRSVLLQQLSGKAAKTIFARFKGAVTRGSRMRPEEVLVLSREVLRGLGLSTRKAEYVHDLAAKVEAGVVDLAKLSHLSDAEVTEHLGQVKGIGPWTAQMFLLFGLKRPDVLATGDLGIRGAVKKAYRMRTLPSPARVAKMATRWHPYCSVACWYLWRSLEDAPGL
ncbi:MAG: DNA-3-methyladenine glycosylase 2 family protein [candidate division NC10 bacterium]|nr:DNA-3-methyladenine glycosylase 2 family protein [candidate division NC10 bacterium]